MTRFVTAFLFTLALSSAAMAQAPQAGGQAIATGLPQVRPCSAKDIVGIWKLVSIAEDPIGPTTEQFNREPQQYLWFQDNSLYGEESGIQSYSEASPLMQNIRRKESQALLQYVVTEKGIIYMYKNRIATDGLNCAYVTQYQEPYKEGDIILFASEKNPTRLMKLYRKPFEGAAAAPAPAAPAPAPAAQPAPAPTPAPAQGQPAVAPQGTLILPPQNDPAPAAQPAPAPAAQPQAQPQAAPAPAPAAQPQPAAQPAPAPEAQQAPAAQPAPIAATPPLPAPPQ